MRVLWIGTKPPVPPVDGGRLAVLETLRALHGAGIEVTLVAPVDPSAADAPGRLRRDLEPVCRPRLVPSRAPGRLRPLLGCLTGPPYAISRHLRAEVTEEVERLLATEPFEIVHCEQLHALAQAEPARRRGVPVVLRAQNVESDLWAAAAELHPWAGPWLRREARHLARYEGQAVRSVTATVALTTEDARKLEQLAGGGARVAVVPPPFPPVLPPAEPPLPGDPPVVLLGSGGWLPNADAVRWFVDTVWPVVRSRCPEAQLHLFAPADGRRLPPGALLHPPPADSRDAFPRGSIQVVPLRIASGIRMKILEAWARGVPVVATPEAAGGLEAENGRELLVAQSPAAIGEAIARLRDSRDLEESLRQGGRGALGRFDAADVAAELRDVYRIAREGQALARPEDGS